MRLFHSSATSPFAHASTSSLSHSRVPCMNPADRTDASSVMAIGRRAALRRASITAGGTGAASADTSTGALPEVTGTTLRSEMTGTAWRVLGADGGAGARGGSSPAASPLFSAMPRLTPLRPPSPSEVGPSACPCRAAAEAPSMTVVAWAAATKLTDDTGAARLRLLARSVGMRRMFFPPPIWAAVF